MTTVFLRSELPGRQGISKPYERESKDYMDGDIAGGSKEVSFPQQCKRLQAKRRIGRKTPENTDKHKRTQLRVDHLSRVNDPDSNADQQATEHVHGECAVRKRCKCTVALNEAAQSISKNCTDESAGADEGRIEEYDFQFLRSVR